VRIAVDAMGGDHAPDEVVLGAVAALEEMDDIEVCLVGQREEIEPRLPDQGRLARLSIVEAQEVISSDEEPVKAVRQKGNSSMMVGLRLVREKQVDALVSAGNTGALMAGALLTLGRLEGIQRPALGTLIPSVKGRGVLLLDVGATVSVRPENLLQFAVMGSIYVNQALGITRPRVGLLNVGVEETKGNEVVKRAYCLLASSNLNFVGNVEGRDIISGVADVIVCDGFVGNVVLKHTEGLAAALFTFFRREFKKSVRTKIGAYLLAPALRAVAGRLDYAEYGGAPLLGVNGICIKCHGSSRRRAIQNGIRVACRLVAGDLTSQIRSNLGAENGEKGASHE